MAVVAALAGTHPVVVVQLPCRSRISRKPQKESHSQRISSSSRNSSSRRSSSRSSLVSRRRSPALLSVAAAAAQVVQLESGVNLHLQQHPAVLQAEQQEQQQTAVKPLSRPLLLRRRLQLQRVLLQQRVLPKHLQKRQQLARALQATSARVLLRLCWQPLLQRHQSWMPALQIQSHRRPQQQQLASQKLKQQVPSRSLQQNPRAKQQQQQQLK
jgi:hypothetical protein